MNEASDGASLADVNNPKGKKRLASSTPRKRRNFQGELVQLHARVDMAIRLLRKCTATNVAMGGNEFVMMALEILDE